MKTSKKIAILVAAICIVLGAAISFTAFAKMDYDITKLDTHEKVTNEVVIEDKFNSISINDSSSDVRIIPSTDKQCRVKFFENSNIHHEARVVNNTLTITSNGEGGWKNFFFMFNFHKLAVEVYLPEKEYNSLDIEVSSGDISVDDTFYFKNADCKCSSGDIKFSADAGELKAETTSGDITFNGIKADTVSTKCTSGDIVGRDVNCDSFGADATSGDIELKSVIASGELRAETSSGDIELKNCDAKNIEFEASSGDIEGSLLTEKRFSADSSSGDIEIPDDGITESQCRAKTSSGDIELWISKEK